MKSAAKAVFVMLCLSLFSPSPIDAAAERAPSDTDNLAMKIISDLGKDKALADKPVWLKVRSVNGNVTLEGAVGSAAEKSWVERRVRRMEGVRSVENRLKILGVAKDSRKL